ncbi:MAG: endonuclease III [Eggerthellaceae bacterium]|nr:endonuclease III [Eggerthellaceae bacterium]
MAKRLSKAKQKELAHEFAIRLNKYFPQARCALDYDGDPFKLAIAVLLSAQTTDKGVNKVTPLLWERYPDAHALANADFAEVEQIIKPIGFYHVKALNIINCARLIDEKFGGKVPQTHEELQSLPGIGRKSANVILNEAFGISEGIAVDTHIFRIAHRLGLSDANDALATEKDLLKVFEKEYWGNINRQGVLFGRETCIARSPKCGTCFFADLCPSKR